LEGGGSVIGVFAPQYKDKHRYLSRAAVVLAYSPNTTFKLSYNALQRTHGIRPKFDSLNTRSLSWISEPFADFAAAQRACNAINDASLTEVERTTKIANVIKWYVDGNELQINWARCNACHHWRKTPELVTDDEWYCPGSCPSQDDTE